ncbi:transcriptional regulator [Corallococcus sp. H22C18031201]|uniref:helix-turn-helix transcriptional regulator n=1 Tax=Citreicoccus inhibens TaxID=2849499 RepID=UPI000E76E0C2|nr:helix-turn-helix transcriptional regulator [Citreicoccus inhibens]MBU8898014.1 helix-turn-helix domain-containing protein [Citreicoccus inhibens]RJS15788.1 transcriptional regulator [Corallococcus sp. H22C18031201]
MYGEREKALRKTLGRNARAARERQKLTQADVAERINLATEVYGRIERGRSFPSIPTFLRLCHALHEPSDRMLGLEDAGGLADIELALVTEPTAPAAGEHPPELRRLLRTLQGCDPGELRALRRLLAAMKKPIR